MSKITPVILIIVDGWGYSEEKEHNAINTAHKPQWDEWWHKKPKMLLSASGQDVGLPEHQMGNSEVGHMHISAGRVVEQDFTRINKAIDSQEFAKNAIFLDTMAILKEAKKSLHIIGLVSDGGVHSHEQHLFALLKMCYTEKFDRVNLHLFLDGRDTPRQNALLSLERLNNTLQQYPGAVIRSISGRHYAMAGAKHWDLIEPVYHLLTKGQSKQHAADAKTAIEAYYHDHIYDEFIPPTLLGETKAIEDGDAILYFNFRSDRARQLTTAFINDSFNEFKRERRPNLSRFITMTQYGQTIQTHHLIPPLSLHNTLGEVLSAHGLTQLRVAETEKQAHVTMFFNGGSETLFDQEQRILIPSPQVKHFDSLPEMSAFKLTQTVIKAIKSKAYDVIICNFANADVLGHTGNFSAAVQAIECLDNCLRQIGIVLAKHGGRLLVTADHGNAEKMYNKMINQPHTAHTDSPVPFIYVGDDWHFFKKEGSLINVAPTLLTLLGLEPPAEMTGEVLIAKN